LIEGLEPQGGGVAYLSLSHVHELVGAELLLEAAASAGARDEALSFLLEHAPIADALAAPLSRVLLPEAGRKAPKPSDDLASRLHQLLRESGPAMAQPKAAAALGVAEAILDAIASEENRKGTLRIAVDRNGTKTLFAGEARP
jgi:hypothetical protein